MKQALELAITENLANESTYSDTSDYSYNFAQVKNTKYIENFFNWNHVKKHTEKWVIKIQVE